jgi:rhamnosyltransferase
MAILCEMHTNLCWSVAFVLFDPDWEKLAPRVKALSRVAPVLLVDNSPEDQHRAAEAAGLIPEAAWLRHGNRAGIAGALNAAADWASTHGEWLLTMDQDSELGTPLALALAAAARRETARGKTAIFAPAHCLEGDHSSPPGPDQWQDVDSVMTSGNLLRLEAWKSIGGFREELFIDSVDHDFCLRLADAQWKVRFNPALQLPHSLGALQRHPVGFGKTLAITHHNPVRRYFITRNRWSTMRWHWRRHPRFVLREFKHQMLDILAIVLFEEKKVSKCKALVWGSWHALKGQLGPAPFRQ